MTESELARFWPKVYEGGECWQWTAHRNRKGYGTFGLHVDGKWRMPLAYRLAYTHWREPIPDGMNIDHLCRNTGCVNPWHLEVVTPSVNALRRVYTPESRAKQQAGDKSNGYAAQRLRNAQRTHCKHGHELTEENTYHRYYKGWHLRHCRTCMANSMARWHQRHKES